MKTLKAFKKWEVKTGENRGYYIAATSQQAEKFYPQWGRLNDEYWSTHCIMRRHQVPQGYVILTHTIWSRGVMRPVWERVITEV